MMEVDLPDIKLRPDTTTLLLPRSRVRSYDWIKDNVLLPDGQPFDGHAYPWTAGICDAWDQPQTRSVWLQFAARLGKTAIGHSLLICAIANNPSPALFGTSTETLAKQTVRLKLLKMLRHCRQTKGWVPADWKLLQTRLDLLVCTIYVSWSGSTTTLADISARWKHANEIDKWDRSVSDEADPLDLFGERGQEVVDRKTLYEGTPAITGRSRVNRGLRQGTDCRWYVPCPKCSHYQMLRLGSGDPKQGGLIWEKNEDGHSELGLTEETARYVCETCQHEIDDEYKRWMNLRGIWVPKGMHVDQKGRLSGSEPSRRDESFQLSRIYSPVCTFGEFAREWVRVKEDPDGLRNFRNSWEGETWDLVQSSKTWQDAANQMTGEHPPMICPSPTVFVTAGVDVQMDHLVYTVAAWAQNAIGYVIDYGTLDSWGSLRDLLGTQYPHDDGGKPLWVVATLIDCRYRTDDVIEFCKSVSQTQRWVYPCAGGTSAMQGRPYRTSKVDEATSTRVANLAHLKHITVATGYWQYWLHQCLENRRRGEPQTVSYPATAADDEDLWTQMINEQPFPSTRRAGTMVWQQVDEHVPVDLRDALRYCRCAAEWYLGGKWNRLQPRRKHALPPMFEQPAVQERPRDQPRRTTDAEPPEARRDTSWVRRLNRRRRR